MSEQLTEGERTVLEELVNLNQRIPTSSLANSLNQGEDRVNSILNSLASRGLVQIHTKERVTYTLTDEGAEYVESGLPEVRLFDGVKELGGKATFDDAVAQAGLDSKTKGIAMNWARRTGWLQISKEDGSTVLQVLVETPESEVADVLNQLSTGKEVVSTTLAESLKQALERKLAIEKVTKSYDSETIGVKSGEIEKLLSVGTEGIGNITPDLLASGAWKDKSFRPYNVDIQPVYANYGKKHPYAEFNDWLREIMVGLGFTEWFGPYVETEFWGHDTLFVPQDHVAREVQDQFRIAAPYDHGHIIDRKYYKAVKEVHENGGNTGSKGWDWPYSEEVATRLCLRPHTTPVSMRYLYEHRESPEKMFIIDRNFRSETLSATHAQEFDQCEGIIMDKGLTLRDLLGYLTSICKGVGINKLKFKPGQFPFTEPSVETFGKHEKLGWIELGGSGIFRPEVTRPLGIKDPVLAWGIGSGRLYMAAMGINDIRENFSRSELAQEEPLCEVKIMIVESRIDDLLSLIGKKLTLQKLEDTLFLIKAEVEKIEGNIIEIEVNPDRQDMLSTEGIARAVRSFLRLETGLRKYPVKKSGKQIIVKPGLSKIRPFICGSIVKGVKADDELIKEYMHLQDALTSTHGRNRSKASIGLYVYDEIKFPIIYGPKKPESIKFKPLGYETEMDGPSIMTDHEKGVEFGHIIKAHKKWPLLFDSNDQVLSLPPIINSNDLGKMTTETSNLFVEVTGTHLLTVHQALNIITASLAEREGSIESLTVIYPDESSDETPDFAPEKMTITIEEVSTMIGLDLSGAQIVEALERMGYGASTKVKTVHVQVPAYRMDILHTVDVIEDIAIGYGFDNLHAAMPQTMTMGKVNPITRLKNKVRDLMVGMGYHEIMNYIMTSPETLNDKMLRNEPLVTTSNPKSRNYSVLRNSLIPVLLDFAAQNQHADYPQKIFEVGDINIPDEAMETRVNQIPSVACLMSDVKVNITALMTEIGYLLRNLGLDDKFKFVAKKSPTFVEGRSAHILVNGKEVGFLGEIAPTVLTNFGIAYPVVAFEIYLPRGLVW